MKVLVQWTLRDPQDWQEIDVATTGSARRAWENLPKRPLPERGQIGAADNNPGWLFGVNVQGVGFGGHDHCAIRPIPGGVEVTVWDDDPDDFPPGEREAQVWTFLDPAPDPDLGGRVNTRQSRIVYTERPERHVEDKRTTLRPWSEFSPPAESITRHGIWVADGKANEHKSRQSIRGWREWIR